MFSVLKFTLLFQAVLRPNNFLYKPPKNTCRRAMFTLFNKREFMKIEDWVAEIWAKVTPLPLRPVCVEIKMFDYITNFCRSAWGCFSPK